MLDKDLEIDFNPNTVRMNKVVKKTEISTGKSEANGNINILMSPCNPIF